MPEALITPDILKWARERCGFSHAELASKLNVSIDKLISWEINSDTDTDTAKLAKPTMRQAKNIASKTHIPFGYLYLDSPPIEDMPLTDFRMGVYIKKKEDEVNLYDFIHSALYKKEWYEAYLADQRINYNSDEYQGKFTLTDDITKIAKSIQNKLGLDEVSSDQPRGRPDKFWPKFTKAAEDADLWIMRTGTVGTSTNRIIDRDVCRGFAITSPYVPIIWVNSRLSNAERTFTLAHELAHIWLGQEGFSNFDTEADTDTQDKNKDIIAAEKFSDKIAAELLVPIDLFDRLWGQKGDTISLIDELYPIFGVSHFVLLRRAKDTEKIDNDDYRRTWKKLKERMHPVKNGGGDANRNLLAKNGRNFTFAVLSEFMKDSITYREAMDLLEVVDHNQLHKIYKDIKEKKL